MDKKLLMDIFHIPSQSMDEDLMREFIVKYLKKLDIPFQIDSYGNVYNLSDTNAPILNAHMDTVQDANDGKLQKFAKIRGNVLSGYGVIGGDDKCGIYIALELLKTEKVNFIFTVEEEIGCRGITAFLTENSIKEFPYALTLDRQGSSDILCFQNNYGDIHLDDELERVGERFGYKSTNGLISDADEISDQISCANLSVGYYNPHTKHEFVSLNDLENALEFTRATVNEVEGHFEAPEKKGGYFYYSHGGGYRDYDYGWADMEGHNKEVTKIHSFPMSYEYNEDDDFFDPAYEEISDELTPTCFITGKKSEEVYFIDSLKKFVSPEGARLLLMDLETCGALDNLLYEQVMVD